MEENKETANKETFISKLGRFASESAISVSKYIMGKLITSAILGIIAFLVFKLLGINLAWLLALILGLTNIVPVFGGWVGMILCAIIAVFFSPIFIVYTTLTALLLQLLEQFVLLPLIVGKAVDLKPLLVICVLIIGSLVFGFWGVLLAIPIAAVIKIGYTIFLKKEKSPDKTEKNQ